MVASELETNNSNRLDSAIIVINNNYSYNSKVAVASCSEAITAETLPPKMANQQQQQQEKPPLSSSSSSAPSIDQPIFVDTSKLRNALRLVHCIQKERGSSCAYYANNTLFESAMYQARQASDVTARLMRPYSDLPIASSLQKIRSLIKRHKNPQDSANDLIFHRLFVCFNTLISSVVHECVLKDLTKNEDGLRRISSTNSLKKQMNNNVNNNVDNDNDDNVDNQQPNKVEKRNRHERHLSKDIDAHLTCNPEALATPERRHYVRKTFAFNAVQSSGPLNEEDEEDDIPEKLKLPFESSSVTSKKTRTNTNVSHNEHQITKEDVEQLLDLLQMFVQLKESAGVERAILSSLLAFRNLRTKQDDGNHSLPSFRMLTNDLILEVENQRALYHKLERLPSGPHHSLVLDLAQLSPRLKDLQQIILTDFESLQGAEYDSEVIWDTITMYIDKLHSVELLIIEDLELACADSLSRSSITSTKKQKGKGQVDTIVDRALEMLWNPPTTANKNGDKVVDHDVMADIRRIPADDLKNRVLALLTGAENSDPPRLNGSRFGSQSVSVHVESAAAEILNEDMHKALHKPLERARSKEWEISIYEIKFTKRLGQGASATTYLGKWTGQNVAVKVASITEFGLEGWRTEVNALQRLHHPNIIRMMGSIYNENPQTHCLVLEYCNAGDLGSALRYPTPRNFFFHVSSSISNAMSYLHKRGILHRDLKPSNILCDGNIASGKFTVKITDFGIATEISRTQVQIDADGSDERGNKLTGETGTYRWMSPEVIRHEFYSTTADVYSFTVMLWQFVTHDEPFCNVSSVDAAKLVATERQRPPLPKKIPAALSEIIEANWADAPSERWEFSRISEALIDLEENISEEEREWLEHPDGHPVYGYENTEEMEPILQEVFAAQPAGNVVRKRSEKGISLGKKIRNVSPKGRGRSPGRKTSLLSSFFRKPSFEAGKL